MNLQGVATQIQTCLEGISGITVFDYLPKSVHPPTAIVAFPDSINYKVAYGGNKQEMYLPILLIVDRVDAKSSAAKLLSFLDSSGPKSIRAAISAYSWDTCDGIITESADITAMTFNGVDYASAAIMLHIIG